MKQKNDIRNSISKDSETRPGVWDGHCLRNEAFRCVTVGIRRIRAKKILQIGTYNGYTALCLNKAIKNTEIWTVDYVPKEPGNYNVCIDRFGHSRDENMKRHKNLKEHLKDKNINNIHLYIDGSDDFFKENKETFDAIIIHGDHAYEQASKDLKNSLKCINKGGIIFMIPAKDKSGHTTANVFDEYEGKKEYYECREGVGIIYA